MPAQRKSSVLLERAGAFRAHPERRRKAIAGRGALPKTPPSHLRRFRGATAAWKQIVAAIPEGIPTGSDQIAIERCAVLLAQSREPGFKAAQESRLCWYLNALGLTPSARESLGGSGTKATANPFDDVGDPVRPSRGR